MINQSKFKLSYNYCCIRCITQRSENKIKQYMSSTTQSYNQTLPASLTNQNSDSSITQQLLANPNWAISYKISMFSILDCIIKTSYTWNITYNITQNWFQQTERISIQLPTNYGFLFASIWTRVIYMGFFLFFPSSRSFLSFLFSSIKQMTL